MKTAERIEKWALEKGMQITIASATSWMGSLNAALRRQNGDRAAAAKMWAYSIYDASYNAIIEPRAAYDSLAALRRDLEAHVAGRITNEYARI